MKYSLFIGAIIFVSLFGKAQIILTNGDFDAYTGPNVNCQCSDFWTCGDDAGRVDLTLHSVYSPGDQGCNTGANFMAQYGNFSPPASMYFYGGDDFAFHQTAINFPVDGEICMGVWYCGPQTPGTPDQNTAACHFTFAIDGVSVGPQIPVPDGTNWTLIILPFPITAGSHTFGLMSGDPGAYAIWFDNFNLDTTFCTLPPCDPGWNADTVFCASENSIDLSTLINGDLNGVWSGIGVTNNTFDISYGTQDITYTLPFPCDTFLTQTIVVDAFTADITANNVSCNGAADGWAVVNTAGDPGPFAFNWNTSSNSDSIFNLSGGTYTVTVTNLASSCSADYSMVIDEGDALNLSFDVVNACLPELGSLTANVTGGSGTYTYTWQHTSDSSNVLYNLDSAYYFLTVTD
ncbi:MAG: hypothetical protein JNJ99_09315, partial [Crocinitomicaceae bacterium]|nr:hypothetical protein [Crocinitomicaceae bacterium]